MGLYDRLERHRVALVDSEPAPDLEPDVAPPPLPVSAPPAGPERQRHAPPAVDPIAAVRRRLQQSLVEKLGPQLYEDIGGDDDPAVRGQGTIAPLPAPEETPPARAGPGRLTPGGTDQVPRHGPLQPPPRGP